MERSTAINEAIRLFGVNFIGLCEITKIASAFGVQVPLSEPEIPYTTKELEMYAKDSILILGTEKMNDGRSLNLLSLREHFGIDPATKEPCFYNQDWYLNEEFMKVSLENKWYLIRKKVIEDSRAVSPVILEKKYTFPSAVLCSYSFFAYWFHARELLWKYDYVWCRDIDHNGDKIYVGRYCDIDGINKNGFSIHRNLALRNSYAAVSVY